MVKKKIKYPSRYEAGNFIINAKKIISTKWWNFHQVRLRLRSLEPNSSPLIHRLSKSYHRKALWLKESSIIVTPMKGCWIVGKKVGWVQREASLTSRGAKVILPFRIYSAFLSFEVDSTEKWPKTQISTKKHLKASTVDTKFKLLFK